MFYIIGKYCDSSCSILGSYDSIADAQRDIHWQGQPRGDLEWLNPEKTVANTCNSNGRFPSNITWYICKPSYLWGAFETLEGELIKTNRGCYTIDAYKDICDKAYGSYHSKVF